MKMSIIRKGVILVACLTAIGCLDGAVKGRIPIVQGYAERRTTSAAGANSRHRDGRTDL